MAGFRKRAPRRASKAAAVIAKPPIALRPYWDGAPDDPFTFARFYWAATGTNRESIAPRFLKKRRPAAALDQPDTAERIDTLLPPDAPQDYADPDFLVEQFERRVESDTTVAFAQVTLRFPDAPNLHHPYETCRAWARDYFVQGMGLPVMAILHAPFRAGSDNAPHVHLMILPRRLGRYGWLEACRELGNDTNRDAVRQSWEAWRAREMRAA